MGTLRAFINGVGDICLDSGSFVCHVALLFLGKMREKCEDREIISAGQSFSRALLGLARAAGSPSKKEVSKDKN